MRKRFLNLVATLGLVSGLFVGAIAPAGAAPEDPGAGKIYFPWVPNNATIAGIAGVTGSVTIQNLEAFAVDVTVTPYKGSATTITLNPRASQTFEADDLGIAEPGSGVVASAKWAGNLDTLSQNGICTAETINPVARGSKDTVDTVATTIAEPYDVKVSQDGKTYKQGSDYKWEPGAGAVAIDWSPAGSEPAGQYTVTVYGCAKPRIAGAEKHTVGTIGARTSDDTEIVDGYTAIPKADVDSARGNNLEGQSRWVVPIVQTNNGWNTELVITNVSGKTTSVSATFYAAGGQGFAGASVALLSGKTLKAGETVTVDLADDAGFPEGEVGSVFVDATNEVVAGAFRAKASTDMMLTTLAQPAQGGAVSTVKYAPLVFRDYNGWNTGINIANLSSSTNQVTVTYYNYAGNAVATEAVTIPPRAMEYVYTPASGNFGVGENQITAARIAGSAPLVAAIDEVKYLGGQGQGHAMSYPAASAQRGGGKAIANGRQLFESVLGLPLFQKGDPSTGFGDTSGINLYNPSDAGVTAWVQFVDSAGVPVAPTVGADDSEAPYRVPLSAGAGATVYSMTFSEMPAGFQGAAVIGVEGAGELVGVSNNVNYEVAGDGSAVFNLARTSFTGFQPGLTASASSATPTADGPVTVTATVADIFGNGIAGVPVQCTVTQGPNAGAAIPATTTDASGVATCTYTDTKAAASNNTDTVEVWADVNGNGTKDAGETTTVTVTWQAGQPSVTASNAAATADGPVNVTATVRDGFGDLASGVPVQCTVTQGPNAGAAIPATTTDASGVATCTYTDTKAAAGNNTDTVEVWADVNGNSTKDAGETTTVTVTWQPGATSFSAVANPASQTVNNPVNVTATVLDGFGDPLAGIAVQCSFAAGSANSTALFTYSPTTGQTDSTGTVTCSYTGTTAGTDTVNVWADLDSNTIQDAGEVKQVTVTWS